MKRPIDEELVNKILDDFNELFVGKNINNIELAKLGFVNNDIAVPMISMIIHCVENIDIFNHKQLHKLSLIIKEYKDEYKKFYLQ